MLYSDLYPEKREYWIMEQIQHILWVQKQIIKQGIEALQGTDKDKGIEWANEKLQGTLDFFVSSLKEILSEKEFNKYLKENNIKWTQPKLVQ